MRVRYFSGLILLLALLLSACEVAIPQEALQQMQANSNTAEVAVDESNSNLTAAQRNVLRGLPNNGPAPELLNDVFLNSEPLRLADLRGQVVIVEFWTYG